MLSTKTEYLLMEDKHFVEQEETLDKQAGDCSCADQFFPVRTNELQKVIIRNYAHLYIQ